MGEGGPTNNYEMGEGGSKNFSGPPHYTFLYAIALNYISRNSEIFHMTLFPFHGTQKVRFSKQSMLIFMEKISMVLNYN